MEQTLQGTIIFGDEFEPIDGILTLEDGIIKDIEEKKIAADIIIAPCFVNAHTHIGDSVIKDPPYLPLAELVQPPNGLKHRILAETSRKDLVASMKGTIHLTLEGLSVLYVLTPRRINTIGIYTKTHIISITLCPPNP